MYINENRMDFIAYLSEKYQKNFKTINDYLFWLYRDSHFDKMKYYQALEEEIVLYCNLQAGKER